MSCIQDSKTNFTNQTGLVPLFYTNMYLLRCINLPITLGTPGNIINSVSYQHGSSTPGTPRIINTWDTSVSYQYVPSTPGTPRSINKSIKNTNMDLGHLGVLLSIIVFYTNMYLSYQVHTPSTTQGTPRNINNSVLYQYGPSTPRSITINNSVLYQHVPILSGTYTFPLHKLHLEILMIVFHTNMDLLYT